MRMRYRVRRSTRRARVGYLPRFAVQGDGTNLAVVVDWQHCWAAESRQIGVAACHPAKNISLDEPQSSFATKKTGGALHDGVKHRLHIGRRAADHAQNVGGGRLVAERFL